MLEKKRFALSFISILLPILLYSIYRFSIGPLVPTLKTVFSLSDFSAGTLLSASIAFTGIGTGLSGYLSPKIGEKKTALLGILIFALPLGISVAFKDVSEFSFFFILNGLGGGLMTTPTYSIAANLLPKRKGTAIGFVSASYNLGGFIGPTLTGSLLNYYGWQYPFLGMAAIGIVFAVLFERGLSEYSSPKRDEESGEGKNQLRSLVKNKNMVALALSMLLADFAFLSYVSWTIYYLESSFALDRSASIALDLYFGIAVGLGGIGIILAGIMYDKVGGRRTAMLSSSMGALLTLLLYLSRSFPIAIAIMFAVGFFSNWFWGTLSAMAQANVLPYQRATAVSFVQTIAFIGAVLGPVVAGSLLGDSVSFVPLILTVSLPYLIFLLIIVLFYKETLSVAPTIIETSD